MKKIILALVLLAFMASSVLAAPGGRKNGYFEKHPASVHHQLPPRPHEKFHHKRHNSFGIGLAAGIIGTAIGSYIVDSYYQPAHYSDVQCFRMVSRLGTRVSEKCVSHVSGMTSARLREVLYLD